MNIYTKSNLPKTGWLHGCFTCARPTTKVIDYFFKEKNHVVYICHSCQKKYKDTHDPLKISFSLHHSIRQYINNNTLEPYKYPSMSLDPPNLKQHRCPPRPPCIPTIIQTPLNELNDTSKNLDDIV